nr:selenide, water dikinase SelD [Chitinophagaceae bacterium]
QKAILADPQTSGGLLISVEEDSLDELLFVLKENDLENFSKPVGRFKKQTGTIIEVQ